jgi:imidazolonepropionase
VAQRRPARPSAGILRLPGPEALTASTINGAHTLGLEDKVGSLQVGKRADLVLLDAPNHVHLPYNLNRDIVRAVVKDGHVI